MAGTLSAAARPARRSGKARDAGLFFAIAALLALSGCISLPQSTALREAGFPGLPPRAELKEVPFHTQDDDLCGPASLAMVLNVAGVPANVESLMEQVYLPGRKGSLQVEMLAATRRNGLLAYTLAPELGAVLREVAAGTPVVALQNLTGIKLWPIWHYAVVIGYDVERNEVVLRTGDQPRRTMSLDLFEFLWRDGGRWSMVALPPGRLPATVDENDYASAAATFERIGRHEEAARSYRALLGRWPQNLVGLIGLGNVAYASGKLADAEAAFRRAAQAHPGSVAARNNHAQALADLGRLEEAEAVARRAAALGGANAAAAQSTLQEIVKRRTETRQQNKPRQNAK